MNVAADYCLHFRIGAETIPSYDFIQNWIFGLYLDPSLPFQDLQERLNTKPNRLI